MNKSTTLVSLFAFLGLIGCSAGAAPQEHVGNQGQAMTNTDCEFPPDGETETTCLAGGGGGGGGDEGGGEGSGGGGGGGGGGGRDRYCTVQIGGALVYGDVTYPGDRASCQTDSGVWGCTARGVKCYF